MIDTQEKIIIFGLGKRFAENIGLLKKQYQIIGISDNKYLKDIEEINYIAPNDLLNYTFSKVVITTRLYYREIFEQLCSIGVEESKIIDLDAAFKKCDEAKYLEDKEKYRYMYKNVQNELCNNFEIDDMYDYPILNEWRQSAGSVGDYFWQDLWGAMRIKKSNSRIHFDIGSRIDGFISNLIVCDIQVKLIDIRPLEVKIPNVTFIQADATKLEQIDEESIESLSALCSLEHFGLGRYGDSINPNSCFEAIDSIQRVMKKGGLIYISLPIGKERLAFNAHRIFYPETVINCFHQMELIEYSVIDTMNNNEPLKVNADIHMYDNSIETKTGLFIFEKK